MTKQTSQLFRHSIAAKLLMLLLVVAFSASCQRNKVDKSKSASADSVVWGDSAYQLNLIANNLYNEGNVDSLEAFVPVAMQTCLEHQQMERYYIIWRVLIEKYIWTDQYEKAMAMAMEMESDAIRRKETHGLFEAYSLLGLGYAYRGNKDESVKYFRKAIDIFQSSNPAPLMEAYNYLSQVLAEDTLDRQWAATLREWKGHIKRNHYSKSHVSPRKWAQWNFQYQRLLSEYLIAHNQFEAAQAALDSTQHYLTLEGSPMLDEIQILYSRYSIASKRHEYDMMFKYAQEIKDKVDGVDNSHKINAMSMKSDALQGLGRYQEALEELQRLNAFKDSLSSADNIKQLNMLNKRFEVNELKLEAERNQVKARERQLLLVSIIAVVVILGMIVFMIYRHWSLVKLEKAHKELRDAYRQLEVANAKAEESLRLKSNFIRQISHEINTPLNVLSGFTQVLTMPDIELSSEEREKLNRGIVENTSRISGLVNKVIELSEANSQTAIERCDRVEVGLIALDAINSINIGHDASIMFSQQISEDTASIVLTTNQKTAAHALMLILDNACKFMAKHVCLTITSDDTNVIFAVEDDGIGVPPEEAEHIFEEFVQLDVYYEGTGIGLTIARSLARKLGGDITLDTSHHPGARFVMTLPRV